MAATSNGQASDDAWGFSENLFAGNLYFDVRANDSLKKPIHSIDNGQVSDLATADLARSEAASNDQSSLGASIWITSDGRIGYSAEDIRGLVDQLAAGETITDSFLYAMKQGSSIVWATVRITITGTNDAPVATADAALVGEDVLSTGSVAGNDQDVDHGALLSFATAGPAPAGFAMAADGSWAFDGSNPAYQALGAGETMELAVAYIVTDEHGASSNATLTLTVTGTNDAPVVSGAVTGAAAEDGVSSTLSALANAQDADGSATLTIVNLPAELPPGVSFDAATRTFTLDAAHPAFQSLAEGATATVTVNYGVSDGIATTPASVSWEVTGSNDAPVVSGAVTAATAEDGAPSNLSALANASDVDGGTTLSVVGVPGDLPPGVSYDAATLSFTLDPSHAAYQSLAAGATIEVIVNYGVSDGTATTPAAVSWTVTGTNDGPVAYPAAATVAEGQAVSGTLLASDADAAASLVFEPYYGSPDGFTLNADGSWTFDAGHPAYQALAEGESRDVAIDYVVTDDRGDTSVSTLTVTVTGANDAPVVSGVVLGSAAEDGAASTLSALANASDVDGGTTLSVVNIPAQLPAGVSYDAATRSFILDPTHAAFQSLAEGMTIEVTVNYGVSDGTALTPAAVSWTVTGTNDGPAAAAATARVAEDGLVSGTVVVSDPDMGASLTVEPRHDSPTGLEMDSDGNWTFDANQTEYQSLAAGESRDVVINYDVADAEGAYAYSTLTITVEGANDAPVTTSQWAEAVEGETATGTLLAFDQDNGAQLTFTVDGEAPAGFALNSDGSWTFDGANSAYDSLGNGDVQLIQVPFTVTDEHGAATSSFMIIRLTGTNDVPVRNGDPLSLTAGTEDTAYVVTQEQLLTGWSDGEGSALQATNLVATNNATVTTNPDGSFTITPAANFHGAIELKYEVTDGSSVAIAVTQLTIAPVNDAAVIGGTRTGSVTEATAASAGTAQYTGQLTISDVDSAASFQARSNQPSDGGFGTFTVTAAGLWTYKLNNANPTVEALATGETLTDSFTLFSADGTAQLISITINGQTDPVYTPPPISTAPDPNDFDLLADSSAAATPVNYTGTSSNNSADGSHAGDSLVGLGGSDNLRGHGGDDFIWGDFQDPATPGSNLNVDQLYGQAGNDTLYGGVGGDTLYGGSGDDTLYANGSNGMDSERNYLFGGSGNDTIVGSVGGDQIRGGTGADTITGGSGGDRFLYGSLSDTGDTITDYTSGWDAFDFTGLGTNYRFVGQVSSPFQLRPGQVGYVVSGGNTTLYLDGYGTEQGIDLQIVLLGVTQLSATDVWFG